MIKRHHMRGDGSIWSISVLTLAAALLLTTVPEIARGQMAAPGGQPSTAKDGEPEVAPRGERAPRAIKYGDWRKLCFKAEGKKALCRTTITGTFNTGQTAVRVDLIEREGDGTARLQIFLPVGLYLQSAIRLTIDQGSLHQIPYVWCLTNACIAGSPADSRTINELETGQTLSLQVVDSNLLTVTTSLPVRNGSQGRSGKDVRSGDR